MLGPTSALLLLSVAGPPGVEWRAPAGCPTHADVLDALAGLTRAPDLEGVRVRGVVRRVAGRFELRLDIHTGRRTQRRVERANACDSLHDAAALMIAIAVDPTEFVGQPAAPPAESEPEPEPDAAVPTPPVPLPPAPAEPVASAPADPAPPPDPPTITPGSPEPEPPTSAEPPRAPAAKPRARRTGGLVRLDGVLDIGATPTIAGDVGLAVGVLHRWLRLEALGLYLPARPLKFDGALVGTLARWALGVRVCGRFLRRALEFPLCLGLEGGQHLARGAGITVRIQDAHPPWFAILLGSGLTWSPHPRVGLGVRTEFVISPLRAPFTVSDRIVFITQPIGFRFTGGLEIRLGPAARRDGSAPARPRSR